MSNEKLRIEEETRRSICRHGFNESKVADELHLPVEYVVKIREKMGKEIASDPAVSLQIAKNISIYIIEGRRERTQIKRDMLAKLLDREQSWVCVKCDTEVQEVQGVLDQLPSYHCPECDKIVKRKLMDKDDVYKRKQSLLRDLLAEDENLVHWLTELEWTGVPKQPEAPQQVIKQNVIVFTSEDDKRIVADYSKLQPMEKEKLVEKLRKEIIKLDREIIEEDNEPK